jgi:hypothetical protein
MRVALMKKTHIVCRQGKQSALRCGFLDLMQIWMICQAQVFRMVD